MGRKRKAGAMLPEGVHTFKSRGKAYYYWRPGRGTTREAELKPTWRRLPDDCGSVAFWTALERARKPVEALSGGLAKMIAAYQASPHYGDLRPATRREYDRYMKTVKAQIGHLEPADITPAHIAEIRDGLGATPAKANAMIRAIAALYKWGRQRGFAQNNPASGIDKLKIGEHRPWPQWAWELTGDMRPELRLACTLALYTGQRLGDVLDMHMGQIKEGLIAVRQAKTGKAMRIPLHRDLGPVLDACRARGALYLVSRPDGSQFTVDQFHAMWGREMAKEPVSRIRREGFVFHGLRKSATVKLAEAGCTEKEIAAVTGQSLQMVAHYSKEADQLRLAREAIRKVEGA
jgi:integrase